MYVNRKFLTNLKSALVHHNKIKFTNFCIFVERFDLFSQFLQYNYNSYYHMWAYMEIKMYPAGRQNMDLYINFRVFVEIRDSRIDNWCGGVFLIVDSTTIPNLF